MATYSKKRQARLNRHIAELPHIPRLTEEDLYLQVQKPSPLPFLLILDRVQDPHNLGACMRTADAAGVQVVVAPSKGSTGFTETVRRVACGGADFIPYLQVPNLANTLRRLRELGVRLVATADQADQDLYDVDLRGPLAIVVGEEGRGVRKLTADLCDHRVRIPMAGRVDCLNLSVAAGVCLFEAVRQRARPGKGVKPII